MLRFVQFFGKDHCKLNKVSTILFSLHVGQLTMIAEQLKNILKDMGEDRFSSIDEILSKKEQNLSEIQSRMTAYQKDFWFDGHEIQSSSDLVKVRAKSSIDIINEQLKTPPYGIFTPGPIVSTSSGSTTGIKKMYPRSLDDYYRYMLGKIRTFQHYGVDSSDVFSSTETGGMFLAHAGHEDAAVICYNATRARTHDPVLTKRLEFMGEMGVTIISGTPTKLLRMARLGPKKYIKNKIKLIISVGEKLTDAEEIAKAFDVKLVTDSYGSVEMGNIFWTCPFGHKHVNDDVLHIIPSNDNDRSLFSNLSSLPVFNYDLGENLNFSYKGKCECGSYLPTVDAFTIDGPSRANKND